MDSHFPRVLSSLRQSQNQDGGWGYRGGSSWTEPTAFALLAMWAAGETSGGFSGGLAYLTRTQRNDGGWPPNPAVDRSTWVTALALLVLARLPDRNWQRADAWLREQSGRESGWAQRVRWWMLGNRPEQDLHHRGWSWYPDTVAWVAPTALSLLALEAAERQQPDPLRRARIDSGIQFLLGRRCADGGWNHGSTRALGYDTASYPETTGLALLALHSQRGPAIEAGLRRASQHLAACRSVDGRCWLELALMAHSRPLPAAPFLEPRDVMSHALYLIARCAAGGGNVFLQDRGLEGGGRG